MGNISHETNKRIAKNTLFLYFRTLVILLVSLYTSRIVLNVLGIDDYGIYNVVGGIILMFQFLNVGMIDASQRFITYELGRKDKIQLQKVFSSSLLIHLFIIILLIILAETGGIWFLNHKMNIPASRMVAANWVFQCSVLTFILKILCVSYNACIIAHEHMKVYAYISILEAILQLAIVFLLKGTASDKLISYAILIFFVTLLTSIMYVVYCRRHFDECKFRYNNDKALLYKMFSFAGWSFLGNMGYSFKMQGINILINLFFGPAVNTARGVAYQVNAGIYNFVANFQIAMKPQITKQYAVGETDSMITLVYNSSRYSFFLLLYPVLPVLIKAPYILHLWLGIIPEYSVMFLRLVLIVTLVNSMAGPLATAIQAKGKIKVFQLTILGITLLDIPASYVALKLGYPPYTVMYVSIITEFIALIVRMWLLNALIPIRVSQFMTRVIGRNTLIFILATIIPIILSAHIPDTLIGLLSICIISIISTTIILLAIGLTSAERFLVFIKIINIIQTIRR